jgi:hypothetical protein
LPELIRQYTIDPYEASAHSRGDETVTIRAGDVADALRLTNVRPAVFFSEPIFRAPREGYTHRVLHIAFGWLLSPLVTGSTSGLIKNP